MTRLARLGELFRVGSSKRILKSQWQSAGVPFYRGREITRLAADGFVDNELFISESLYAELSGKYGVPDVDDIMVTAIGTIGNSYVVKTGDRFYFKDASVLWLKQKAEVSSEFINYWLKSDQFIGQLDKGNGATVDTLTIQKLQSVCIELPPLPLQLRIVAILDEAFEGVATAKANAEKCLQNAREWVVGQLTAVLSAASVSGRSDMLETLVAPSCTLSYGIVQPGDDMPGGLPVVRPVDLGGKVVYAEGLKCIDPALARAYARTALEGNDLLLCVRGTTGTVAVADPTLAGANVTRGIVPIRFDPRTISQDLGYYLMRSQSVQAQIREKTYGAALLQINIGDLRKIVIAFPPLEKQAALVGKLDAIEKAAHQLIDIYERKVAALDELKKALLHQAFSGALTGKGAELQVAEVV